MEVLFKPMDLGSRQQAIFSDNWGPEYGVWINSNNTLQGVAYTSVSTSNIQVGRWYYAILNIQPGENKGSTDQTYLQFYVNGQFIGENNTNTGNGMNDQPFSLGFDYKSNNPAAFFSGSIASARLSYGQYDQADVNFNYYGGNIVTDGLVFAVDAGNLVSYESGSTTAYSLTGSADGTLNNGVGFSSGNGGTWEFDGVDDYINMGTGLLNLQNASFSLEAWIKWDGGSEDTFFGYVYTGAPNQNIHWRIYPSGALRFDFYADSINSSAGSIVVDEWTHLLVTYDYTTDTCICYKNGNILMQGSAGPFTGIDASSTAYLGSWGSNQYYGGDLSTFKAYNKALTAAEVTQNYNANINRFN
jgi:hypothetical protein